MQSSTFCLRRDPCIYIYLRAKDRNRINKIIHIANTAVFAFVVVIHQATSCLRFPRASCASRADTPPRSTATLRPCLTQWTRTTLGLSGGLMDEELLRQGVLKRQPATHCRLMESPASTKACTSASSTRKVAGFRPLLSFILGVSYLS